MDDEEDIRKLTQVLNEHKTVESYNFQMEFEDFINFNDEVDEDTLEDDNYEDVLDNTENLDVSKFTTYTPLVTLKTEEKKIIENCNDPELKTLLYLNRSKNMKLIQYYKKIKDLLIECQKNIAAKSEQLKHMIKIKTTGNFVTGAWKMGAPYFKDKDFFPCPHNADVNRKRLNGEISIYDIAIPPRWTTQECNNLLRAVKLNYNINRQKDINKKIMNLRKSCEDLTPEERSVKDKEIECLQNQMEELNEVGDRDVPPLKDDSAIDWYRVSETFIKGKHTPNECKSFWNIYLHPDINKSAWTDAENNEIKKLVTKFKCQNWDEITSSLKTNRSPFATCHHYFSNLSNKFKKDKFTSKEDEMLVELVNYYRMGKYIPWFKIVHHFKNRSRPQLFHRYTYYLSNTNVKRGKFSDAEDILLMILVDRFGRTFSKCATYFPDRSQVQLKARYNSNLTSLLKKGSFTVEDDRNILDYVEKYGTKNWSGLTTKIQRCRGQIRQRYMTLLQYFKDTPNGTLENAPRRKHERMNTNDSFQFLRYVADYFKEKDYIPTLDAIEKIVGAAQNKENPDIPLIAESLEKTDGSEASEDIDNLLVGFFCNSFKVKSTQKLINSDNLVVAAHNSALLLTNLGANLELPPNFDDNPKLDAIDIAILELLVEKEKHLVKMSEKRINPMKVSIPTSISVLVPPNINTLIGLRSLLIKHKTYKSKNKLKTYNTQIFDPLKNPMHWKNIETDMEKYLDALDPCVRCIIKAERKLFYLRFFSLFKWPSILTLRSPTNELYSSSFYVENSIKPTNVYNGKRTYAKIKEEEIVPPKKSKTDDVNDEQQLYMYNETDYSEEVLEIPLGSSDPRDLPSTSSNAPTNSISCASSTSNGEVVPLKLIPVDKSVIKNLIKSGKKPKIHRIESVSKDKIQIIDTYKFVANNSNTSVQNVKEVIECIDSEEDEDLQDLKKLDSFLNEAKSDFSNRNVEFIDVGEDVDIFDDKSNVSDDEYPGYM